MQRQIGYVLLVLISLTWLPDSVDGQSINNQPTIILSRTHRQAVDRRRRVIMQYDINCEGMPLGSRSKSVGPELRQESIDLPFQCGDGSDQLCHCFGAGGVF